LTIVSESAEEQSLQTAIGVTFAFRSCFNRDANMVSPQKRSCAASHRGSSFPPSRDAFFPDGATLEEDVIVMNCKPSSGGFFNRLMQPAGVEVNAIFS
jgi:hypothetical protein